MPSSELTLVVYTFVECLFVCLFCRSLTAMVEYVGSEELVRHILYSGIDDCLKVKKAGCIKLTILRFFFSS